MYTSDIENRQHQSLLEHRRRQIGNRPIVRCRLSATSPYRCISSRYDL